MEEVENLVFAGAQAACCSLLLDQAQSPRMLATLQANPTILHLLLVACR